MASGDAAAAQGFIPVLSTDDIRLGYDGINRAADLAAALFGPLTGTPTLGSGMSAFPDTLNSLKRRGKRVVISFALQKNGNFAAGDPVLTLPAAFRPSTAVVFSATLAKTGAGWLTITMPCRIATDGVLSVLAAPTQNADVAIATIPFDYA